MRGMFNLFQKRGHFRPEPGMPLELEWNESGDVVLYAKIKQVQRRKMVVTCAGPLPRIAPGARVRVCNLSPPWFYTYTASVHNCEGDTLELSLPNNELDSHQIPTFSEEDKVEYATHVDYQASRSPYKQAAEVVAVSRRGLTLQTNVSIPSQTQLELHLKLPNRSEPLPAQVRAVRSQDAGDDRRKYTTEVEFVTIPEPERMALWDVALSYHLRTTTRGQAS